MAFTKDEFQDFRHSGAGGILEDHYHKAVWTLGFAGMMVAPTQTFPDWCTLVGLIRAAWLNMIEFILPGCASRTSPCE